MDRARKDRVIAHWAKFRPQELPMVAVSPDGRAICVRVKLLVPEALGSYVPRANGWLISVGRVWKQ